MGLTGEDVRSNAVMVTTNEILLANSRRRTLKSSILLKQYCSSLVAFNEMKIPTVVWEKKGTLICELILERYICLRNTQKQQKITNYVRNKSFSEFYPVYNGVCLKLLGSLLWKLGDFAPLCIKIGGWFCVITTINVLSTFYSVFVYISYIFKMPVIHWLHWEAGSSPVFTLSKWRDIL